MRAVDTGFDWAAARRREREQEAEGLRLIETALRSGESFGAATYAVDLGLADKVPPMLYRLWLAGEIDDDYLPRAVAAVWVHNESPRRGLGERAWLRLFKATGFISAVKPGAIAMHNADGTVTRREAKFDLIQDQPTEPVDAWRGASLQSKGRGMSWTLYRDCALPFAEAWTLTGVDGGVFRATLPVRAILAVFGDEREQEFVVNPNMLRGRVVLDKTIPAEALRTIPHPLFP